MLCFSMFLMLGISCIVFGHIPILSEHGPVFSELCLKVLLSFLRGFLNGALWAMTGGFAAVVARNGYMAYAVPFILYYVMSVFQERYYRALFFLSPRYWMAPIYYNDLFCILVLFTICVLASLLFMWALKRRLDHA